MKFDAAGFMPGGVLLFVMLPDFPRTPVWRYRFVIAR